MAARTPRRSFANPFVVTLAAAPACFTSASSTPPPQPPPPAEQEIVATNPPAPQPPPRPEPAPPAAKERWIVMKSGTSCFAREHFECPPPGDTRPTATCNPPKPMEYACPPDMPDKATLIVAQYPGSDACFVERAPPKCPPNVMCNPPPPQRVACPKRP